MIEVDEDVCMGKGGALGEGRQQANEAHAEGTDDAPMKERSDAELHGRPPPHFADCGLDRPSVQARVGQLVSFDVFVFVFVCS
jgi:hypothetical protein